MHIHTQPYRETRYHQHHQRKITKKSGETIAEKKVRTVFGMSDNDRDNSRDTETEEMNEK